MCGIHEVVSLLTKSGVGCEIICSKEGGCQIVGPGPTGKVNSLTSRIGWTEVFTKCSFSVVVGGFDISCALWSRWAATVSCRVGCSPSGYCWFIFSHYDLGGGVEFDLISAVSSASEGSFTSEWVDNVGTTGGSENSHLSSLRNAWGIVGVLLVGYLVHPPKVPQIFLVKEALVEKDHYS